MAKVEVFIEEHLVKKVEVEVPDELGLPERMEEAERVVLSRYKNKEIILTADDANGVRQRMIKDLISGEETGWDEF